MLYGLYQISHAFWYFMINKLEKCCLKQTNFYPWLFVGDKVPCIVCIDDLIFWARNEDNIHNLEMNYQELDVDLEQEDDAAGFLGVTSEE